jgi:hypothetical protein
MSKATLSRILTIAGNSPNEKPYCTVDPQENIQYLKGLVKSMSRRLQAVVNIKGWITKCCTAAYRSVEKYFSIFSALFPTVSSQIAQEFLKGVRKSICRSW